MQRAQCLARLSRGEVQGWQVGMRAAGEAAWQVHLATAQPARAVSAAQGLWQVLLRQGVRLSGPLGGATGGLAAPRNFQPLPQALQQALGQGQGLLLVGQSVLRQGVPLLLRLAHWVRLQGPVAAATGAWWSCLGCQGCHPLLHQVRSVQ